MHGGFPHPEVSSYLSCSLHPCHLLFRDTGHFTDALAKKLQRSHVADGPFPLTFWRSDSIHLAVRFFRHFFLFLAACILVLFISCIVSNFILSVYFIAALALLFFFCCLPYSNVLIPKHMILVSLFFSVNNFYAFF